ncbi:response regulator transcription factor [Alteromonas macleodii]|uniref:Two-component response regulator n=1 Tax=Alteromonas macleodii (strain English Channel 673) TaxID=1004788 RepID=A0AB32ZV87_ALTME|nr:response regulator transcription factor [Alteromonas macleodii]MEC9126327.1 response regulator transcription factor [Pseudomonadota bacterium]AFT73508.1 two-component response regulator [Alteromonas macleodii str. 'English Channel 673']AUI81525.1 DNA-binding response regulator [Alteromonas macleodii]KHT57068.1 chemotaxis protein CheY [Alteromonas macleodii]MBL3808991.1 response regulator transcription factor [Alteromonas macleodii]
MQKILLIEDSREVAGILFEYYESKGVELDYADNGELGFELAKAESFDLILLDLMLPRMDGLTLCNKLRDEGITTPILMLTALDNREDMLNGFKHGADDYLTKPFDFDLLDARANALIKRYKGQVATSILQFGTLKIIQKSRKAYRDDKLLVLNPTTYTILELLCQKAPEIVSRQEIAEKLWQEHEPQNDVLRSHIYQLRNQLDKPFHSPMLITVPKIGFRLEEV